MTYRDPYYLILNVLYHTENLYEATIEIQKKVDLGFLETKDSEYYQDVGRDFGKLFYYTFYNIADFVYPDIELQYPTDFDDEELLFFN